MFLYFLEQEELLQNMNTADIMCRYEVLSKKCNKLSKENTELQLECDRLTKEVQVLKRTTMRKLIQYLLFKIILKNYL